MILHQISPSTTTVSRDNLSTVLLEVEELTKFANQLFNSLEEEFQKTSKRVQEVSVKTEELRKGKVNETLQNLRSPTEGILYVNKTNSEKGGKFISTKGGPPTNYFDRPKELIALRQACESAPDFSIFRDIAPGFKCQEKFSNPNFILEEWARKEEAKNEEEEKRLREEKETRKRNKQEKKRKEQGGVGTGPEISRLENQDSFRRTPSMEQQQSIEIPTTTTAPPPPPAKSPTRRAARPPSETFAIAARAPSDGNLPVRPVRGERPLPTIPTSKPTISQQQQPPAPLPRPARPRTAIANVPPVLEKQPIDKSAGQQSARSLAPPPPPPPAFNEMTISASAMINPTKEQEVFVSPPIPSEVLVLAPNIDMNVMKEVVNVPQEHVQEQGFVATNANVEEESKTIQPVQRKARAARPPAPTLAQEPSIRKPAPPPPSSPMKSTIPIAAASASPQQTRRPPRPSSQEVVQLEPEINNQDDEDETIPDPLQKYRQMLKNQMPQGAVEQMMRRDNIDPSLLFGANTQSAVTPPSPVASTIEGDGLEKYRLMQKMNLPQGAIEQAMIRDKRDPALLFGGNVISSTAAPVKIVIQKKASSSPASPTNTPSSNMMEELMKGKTLRPVISTTLKEKSPSKSSALLEQIVNGRNTLTSTVAMPAPKQPAASGLDGAGIAGIIARRMAIIGEKGSDTDSSVGSEWDDSEEE